MHFIDLCVSMMPATHRPNSCSFSVKSARGRPLTSFLFFKIVSAVLGIYLDFHINFRISLGTSVRKPAGDVYGDSLTANILI